jgi:hypothetical protein
MQSVNRRFAMKAGTVGAVAAGTAIVGRTAVGSEQKVSDQWTLEGELKVHPKFIYRYYLLLSAGQTCALYGADHARESEQLAQLKPPVRIRVRGTLGTQHHGGGTKENPSPFPETWIVYMDVHEVETMK